MTREHVPPPPLTKLPCGCKHGNTTTKDGQRVYFFKPCRLDCPNYVYAQRESQRQGKPLRFQAVR